MSITHDDSASSDSFARVAFEPMFRTVSDSFYCNLIPQEMDIRRLNKMCKAVFGMSVIPMYQERRIFDKRTILITDFSSNGFFWAQFEDELVSSEFQNAFEIVSNATQAKSSNAYTPWCIAKFQDEWFRAYIEEKLDDNRVKVFFMDYGTTSVIHQSDLVFVENEDLWLPPPLAVPFVIKDITLSKLNSFKEMQYKSFGIESMKLIEKTCIFEVQLKDESERDLVSTL